MFNKKKMHKRKPMTMIITIALALALTLSGCGGTKSDDKVLAVVNGTNLTEAEYNQRFNIIAGQYDFDPNNAEHMEYQKELREQIVNSMIDEAVLLEEATKRNITVTAEEIEADVANYKASFSSQKEFEEYLSQYLKLTEADFRELLRKDLIISKLFEVVTVDVTKSPVAPREYFDNNRELFVQQEEISATHILVETEAEAKALIAQINEGADMGQLAAEKSIDKSAQSNKGDLGYFVKGKMVPTFDAAVFSMEEVGTLYPEPVKTEFGYHVIRLDDRLAPEDMNFSDVEEEIEFYLIDDEKNRIFAEFINELRDASEIEMK